MSLWTELGLEDYSATLHSTGMSYWNLIGLVAGLRRDRRDAGTARRPVRVRWRRRAQRLGLVPCEVSTTRSCWWSSSGTRAILTKVSFSGKMDSLLLAYHRWGQRPEALDSVLLDQRAWPRCRIIGRLRRRVKDGFETAAHENAFAARSDAMWSFFQAVLQETDDGRWRLSQLIERGVQ